jgi:LEM3 (ligand-effect modulator 3) family / CDC50 family
VQVQELTIDYTNCGTIANSDSFSTIPSVLVSSHFTSNSTNLPQPAWKASQILNETLNVEQVQCQIQFTLPTDFTPPVMLYYRLTDFHQNDRRYVKSYDTGQLQGQNKTVAELNSASISSSAGGCEPLVAAPNGKPYYPCGLVANSMFNGTLL